MSATRPILYILPGWGGSAATWASFISEAEKSFEVRCIELPCFGDTPCPNAVWGIAEYAAYAHEHIQKQPKNNAKKILLGHSFGGQVAVKLLSLYPGSVDECVLIGAAVVRPKRTIKRAVLKFCSHVFNGLIRGTVLKQRIYRFIGSPDYLQTSGIKRSIFERVIREDVQNLLPPIKQHILIFWGKKDRYTPLKHGERIAKKLNDRELVIFPDGRHGLHHTHVDAILTKLKERYT